MNIEPENYQKQNLFFSTFIYSIKVSEQSGHNKYIIIDKSLSIIGRLSLQGHSR